MKLTWHKQTLTIKQPHWTSLDAMFEYFHISKKNRYRCYQQGCIHLNHTIIKTNTTLQIKDEIAIHPIQESVEEVCTPCYDALPILYEDELFLIVDKPSGMLVHSDGVRTQTTLYDLVKGYYITQGKDCLVRAIHRLDYDTTGAVIFCKIPFLQPLLDHMLKEKQIQRCYRALCEGRIQSSQFTVDAPIGSDRHHASRMRISTHGKQARTDVRVIKCYSDYSYIECQLHQGRTHQIRVHLASLSHPLLHDTLYGNRDPRIQRTALHAHQVNLFHPLLQQQLCIQCPLPDDIKSLL